MLDIRDFLSKNRNRIGLFLISVVSTFCLVSYKDFLENTEIIPLPDIEVEKVLESPRYTAPTLDVKFYEEKIQQLANISNKEGGDTGDVIWPAKTVYPNYGAILPFNRIVAYYGNFYSPQMGILGEYPKKTLLEKLSSDVKSWESVDLTTPVVPAIHYIAAVAQQDATINKKYLFRMPASQIQKALDLAKEIKGILFLDLQIGMSDVGSEMAIINEYLKLSNVHLALDPEFAMKDNKTPGTVIGRLDSSEINKAIEILDEIVMVNNLPPKILVIHRFTQNSVIDYQKIVPTKNVQVVINMDGWGSPELKKNTYKNVIYKEPVQFTGFKIFYKNDLFLPSTRLTTPEEILKLSPQPSYIQYQ